MFDPVVGEGLKAAAEPLVGVARLLVDGVEQGVDLCQIARGRQCEQLLLGGEVPVDQGLVDADPAGDVVDAGVLCFHARRIARGSRRRSCARARGV